jgi:hypothetical protein
MASAVKAKSGRMALGSDSRLFRIAICGALLNVGPPMYVQYDLRPPRLTVHPHLIDSLRRSSTAGRR